MSTTNEIKERIIKNSIKTKIYELKELLNKAEIYPDIKGYHLILRAIELIERDRKILMLDVYNQIAKENNISIVNTERLIRYVIIKLCDRIYHKELTVKQFLFGFVYGVI